ncbi:MAG TPA: DUF1844 domain-containing protein [Chthoniobacterales bacterium]|jgi:hypothetical protein|nr:DUF1844 domain-containing protein [Chthoniobacterales bacterium]
MAGETQTSTQSGELSQRFIEFVMMQAQNAALFLGQIPNPKTGEGEVNLELAKMFIDQLAMIQEKTRGNLTTDEATVLKNTLSNLQMMYVEVARQSPQGAAEPKPSAPEPEPQPEKSTSTSQQPPSEPATSAEEGESKKKFTKSYGS